MNIKELERRHETGERQPHKGIRAQIKAQLARKCTQRGCTTSLAFARATKVLCDVHKGIPLAKAVASNVKKRPTKRYTKAEMRKINRDKKKRYYERHGITFDKTVRNREITELNPKTNGAIYAGQTLLYEHYKEPLKPIEKGKGYGFYGTVALTSDKEYVQCHICGNLFGNVSAHLRRHKISAERYKEMYGLGAETALISEPVRRIMMERVVSKSQVAIKGELPIWLQEYNKKVQTGQVRHPGSKRRQGGLSLEKRNQLGLCPDQVLEKIRELADKLGHTPSLDEFNAEYKGRFTGSINFQHGSYLKAVAKLGMKSAKEVFQPSREELLQDLVDFKEKHGRIPMTSDFKRGLLHSRTTYFQHFGTLNNARIEAGLNAIIPMPFGQHVEMSPDEYLEYKNNRLTTKQKRKRDAKNYL